MTSRPQIYHNNLMIINLDQSSDAAHLVSDRGFTVNTWLCSDSLKIVWSLSGDQSLWSAFFLHLNFVTTGPSKPAVTAKSQVKSRRLAYISKGKLGVWGVTSNGDIYTFINDGMQLLSHKFAACLMIKYISNLPIFSSSIYLECLLPAFDIKRAICRIWILIAWDLFKYNASISYQCIKQNKLLFNRERLDKSMWYEFNSNFLWFLCMGTRHIWSHLQISGYKQMAANPWCSDSCE